MKTSSVLALAATLALGVSLSAQTVPSDATTSSTNTTVIARAKMPSRKAAPAAQDPVTTNLSKTSNGSDEQKADYRKNPYWAPQDYSYMEENIGG